MNSVTLKTTQCALNLTDNVRNMGFDVSSAAHVHPASHILHQQLVCPSAHKATCPSFQFLTCIFTAEFLNPFLPRFFVWTHLLKRFFFSNPKVSHPLAMHRIWGPERLWRPERFWGTANYSQRQDPNSDLLALKPVLFHHCLWFPQLLPNTLENLS